MGPLAVNVERSDVFVVLDAGQHERVEVSLFLYFGTFSDVDVLAGDYILLRVPSNLFQGTPCKYDVAGNRMIFEKKENLFAVQFSAFRPSNLKITVQCVENMSFGIRVHAVTLG